MQDIRVSFITTVLNEEKTIHLLLQSLFDQTKLPDEIIIADGGSIDKTVKIISDFKFPKIDIKVIEKKGNRSIGRNAAIGSSRGDIIVCSDAGCILDKDFIENITKPFTDNSIDVVAGYYAVKTKSIFGKCLSPYVLVMKDRVDPEKFLPATRSCAFTKNVWEKAGGYPESLSHNEDYVFARKVKGMNFKIKFAENAIAYWQPRENFMDSFVMFFRFALGDAEAGMLRPKVILIFLRYLISSLVLVFYFISKESFLLSSFLFLSLLYFLWAIKKNYRYVKDLRAVLILPSLQLVSDFAVMIGSFIGFLSGFKRP